MIYDKDYYCAGCKTKESLTEWFRVKVIATGLPVICYVCPECAYLLNQAHEYALYRKAETAKKKWESENQ